jgi:hypothetical protein
MKFYRSKNGSVVIKPFDIPCECEVIEPNTTDAAGEKHVPVIEVSGNTVTVKVGEVEHPMIEAHYIQFIALETKNHPKFKFVWITDGHGWGSARNNLKETFDVLDNLYNIMDLDDGVVATKLV